MTKHSSADVLDIEPNPVKLARQSIDKVEEICNVFFDTMKEAKALGMRVKDLVSAIRQGGGEEVEKADELFGILMKNEDFVIRMDNTCEFLEVSLKQRFCFYNIRSYTATGIPFNALYTFGNIVKDRYSHLVYPNVCMN